MFSFPRLILLFAGSVLQISPAITYDGSSPQLAIDSRGTIRMLFGRSDTIFVVASTDNGKTFGAPVIAGVVQGMHLGSTRGPTIASSRDVSLAMAVDKAGDVHLFKLVHQTSRWSKLRRPLNDSSGSAPEGLGSIAADNDGNFYATWLDLRVGRQNQIYFAKIPKGAERPVTNKRLYASPDGHVCECCRPTVAVSNGHVAVMFRNWLGGSRDIYSMASSDGGKTFSDARKLGTGTWKLDACPMDGGDVTVDQAGNIATVWRRQDTIYFAKPGQNEQVVTTGRSAMMSQRADITYLVWQQGPDVMFKTMSSQTGTTVGQGRLPQVLALSDGHALVVWERSGKVFARKLR